MTNPIAIGLAVAATASLALAHGDDEKNGEGKLLSSLFQNSGTTTKYTPGKGITWDGGDDYKITLGGRLQAKFYYQNLENAEDTAGFRLRRARTKIKGHLWNRDITFYLQNDHTGGTSILDGWVNWGFNNTETASTGVRLGLQKTRGGRESDGTSAALEFVERSLASRTFADARGTGAMLHGSAFDADDGTRTVHWHAGAFNNDTAGGSGATSAEGTNNGDNHLNYTFGVRFDPQGDLGAEGFQQGDLDHSGVFQTGFNANLLIGETAIATTGVETTAINLGAVMKSGTGFAGQVEFWLRTDDPDGGNDADSTGFYVQGSYTTAGDQLQYGFAGRVSQVSIDDPNPVLSPLGMQRGQGDPLGGLTGDVLEVQGAVNAYYHKHLLKSQLAYTFQNADADSASDLTNHSVDIMFTMAF